MVERLSVASIHLFPARNCAIPSCPLHTVDDGKHAGHIDTVTGGPVMVGSPFVQCSMTTLGTRPSPGLPHRRQGRDVGGRLHKADGPILLRSDRRGSPRGPHAWPTAPVPPNTRRSSVPGCMGLTPA